MRSDLPDPHAALRDAVLASVLDGPGEAPAALRHAAAENAGATLASDASGGSMALATLVAKVHQHAYRVTDDDVASLRAVYGDDALFELIVSASLGASRARLDAGLRALDATEESR